MNEESRIQILLAAVEERYKSIHAMRERVYTTCSWTLGIFLLVTGWVVQANIKLTLTQKFFLCVAFLTAVFFIRSFYLRDIERGFKGQLRAAAKIEEALGLYELGIYPESWKKAGTNQGNGSFFQTTYLLLYIGAGILTGALLLG